MIQLIDRYGRVHRSLRVSVTDRCNLRCFYCMPEVGAEFAPREQLLSFEEIRRVVSLLVSRCGFDDIRVTGGEPLVRKEIEVLVEQLAGIDGLSDLSMTTNGILLADHANELKQAGLNRLNISLDTLDEAVFQRVARRKGIHQVVNGIDAAIAAGFDSIKLNTTAIKGVTENEIESLVKFAADRDVELRFIEFMPLDTDRAWNSKQVLSGETILQIIESRFGPMKIRSRPHPSQPAEAFETSGGVRLGLIRSVTAPFCEACNRLRITADGSIRNCLFSHQEFSIRDRMRQGVSDDELLAQFTAAVEAKNAGHGIDGEGFAPPDRPMYSIGG